MPPFYSLLSLHAFLLLILGAAHTVIVSSFSSVSPPPHNKLASSAAHLIDHLLNPPLQAAPPLEDLANVRIPGPSSSSSDILAYMATPSTKSDENEDNTIILLHEFFGLNPSIVEKAQGLADDLGCRVVAPDIFRGQNTDFIPKAIWLAVTTPQDRVNEDLDAVCAYLSEKHESNRGKLAVMGFCLGGGKAIRYTAERRPDAATVVFYGSPLTDVNKLQNLKGPVCGIFGNKDAQFPAALLQQFKTSLSEAGVKNDVRIYDGVGHAFWTDMGQVRRGEQPQADAYEQCTSFLSEFLRERY